MAVREDAVADEVELAVVVSVVNAGVAVVDSVVNVVVDGVIAVVSVVLVVAFAVLVVPSDELVVVEVVARISVIRAGVIRTD